MFLVTQENEILNCDKANTINILKHSTEEVYEVNCCFSNGDAVTIFKTSKEITAKDLISGIVNALQSKKEVFSVEWWLVDYRREE